MLSPREILGDQVLDLIRDSLLKLGIKPEHIFEIILDVEKSVPTVEVYAKKISSSELPCVLYFITHLFRSDKSFELSLIRHEMHVDGKSKTGFEYSLFSFQYRIIQDTLSGESRFRIDLIKAREDLRGILVKPAILSLIQFARKEYPGLTIETRADNMIAGNLAGKVLEEARFISITHPQIHAISHILDGEFIKLLRKAQVIHSGQKNKLLELIAQKKNPDEEMSHRIQIHNLLIKFIRENIAKLDSFENEVSFLFQRFLALPESKNFLEKSPYRGDLWIEGEQP